jgi:hypothetical protein
VQGALLIVDDQFVGVGRKRLLAVLRVSLSLFVALSRTCGSAYRRAMAKPWKCRLGLHRFVKRRDSQDPNMQVCVRCGRERIADAIWGVLGRRGPG